MAEFGTSRHAITKIFQVPQQSCPEKSRHRTKNVSQIAHDLQTQQTQGVELKEVGNYIKDFFQDNLLLERMCESDSRTFILHKTAVEYVVSLKAWTSTIFINAGQKTYFGDRLSEIDSGLPQALIRLDELSWQIFYQYPKLLRPELNQTSTRIRKSLETYLEIPAKERQSKAWFTQALEREYRRVGLDNKDIASQMLFLYWG